MRSRWSMFCVFAFVGCSHPEIRAESSRDSVHVELATGSLTLSLDGNDAGQQPDVMFRCEEGKVGAYVVTGSLDSLISGEQLVRIALDSAPDC